MQQKDQVKSLLSQGKIEIAILQLLKKYDVKELRILNGRMALLEESYKKKEIGKQKYKNEVTKIGLELQNFIKSKEQDARPQKKQKMLLFIGTIVTCSFIIFILYSRSNANYEEIKFKVVVTPFNPYKNCTIEENGIEIAQIEYFKKLFNKEDLPIIFEYYDDGKCPYSTENIEDIQKHENADLVLWGNYIEDCEDEDIKINFRSNSNMLYSRYTYPMENNLDTFYTVKGVERILKGDFQTELVFAIFNNLATKALLDKAHHRDIKIHLDEYFRILMIGAEHIAKNQANIARTFHSIHETFAIACSIYAKHNQTTKEFSSSLNSAFVEWRGKLMSRFSGGKDLPFLKFIEFIHLVRGIETLLYGDIIDKSYVINDQPLVKDVIFVFANIAYDYYVEENGWKERADMEKWVDKFFLYIKTYNASAVNDVRLRGIIQTE